MSRSEDNAQNRLIKTEGRRELGEIEASCRVLKCDFPAEMAAAAHCIEIVWIRELPE